jgi:hypothetical protein
MHLQSKLLGQAEVKLEEVLMADRLVLGLNPQQVIIQFEQFTLLCL